MDSTLLISSFGEDQAGGGVNRVEAFSCFPRPNVTVAAAPSGPGRIEATVTAGTASTMGTNQITRIQFGPASSGLIDAGGVVGWTGNFTLTPPAGTQQASFLGRRAGAGAVTVPMTVTDVCGDWPTFVGFGPGVPQRSSGPDQLAGR